MKNLTKIKFLIFACFLLLTSYGCNSGGGDGISYISQGNSLYAFNNDSYNNVVKVHNPEPATMILLGSGFAAMAYANKKRRKYK